jgi:hypothetical protein
MFDSISSPSVRANTTPLHSPQGNRAGRTASMGSLLEAPVQDVQVPLPKPLAPQGALTTDTLIRRFTMHDVPVTYEGEEGLSGIHVLGSSGAKKVVRAELQNPQNELHTVRILGQLEQSIRHIPHGQSQRGYAQSLRDTVKQLPAVSPKLKDVFSKSVKGLIS